MNAPELMASAADGQLMTDLDEALVEAIKAMDKTRKAATITIKLSLTPISVDDDGKMTQFAIGGEINEKLPKNKPAAGLYFVGQDGKASRRNPNQPELPVVGDSGGEYHQSSMTAEEKEKQRNKTA